MSRHDGAVPCPQLTLRPLAAEHVDALSTWLDDPALLRFVPHPDPVPPDLAEQWVRRYEQGRQNGAPLGFAAEAADGELIGIGVVPHVDARALNVELGYVVAPHARRRGVGPVLLRALTTWASAAGYQRAALYIDVDNTPSLRLARAAGYVQEGVLRSFLLTCGVRHDAAVWSRLPTDGRPDADGR